MTDVTRTSNSIVYSQAVPWAGQFTESPLQTRYTERHAPSETVPVPGLGQRRVPLNSETRTTSSKRKNSNFMVLVFRRFD